MMRAIRLQVESLTSPLGLGNPNPRFYWNAAGGITQTAYRIICQREGCVIWDSGKVSSSSMRHIRYGGEPLNSRDRVSWSVQLWDEADEPGGIVCSQFEMGLLSQNDYIARWISGDYRPRKNRRYPVDCFCRSFSLGKDITKARLYATARGLYDVTLNGRRLEDFILAPGSTDYRKRVQVQTYDVTELLEENNIMELRLSDGWFRGSVAAYGVTDVYGTQTSVMAQLEVIFADGHRETIGTDSSWKWSNDGSLRFADLKDGEICDAGMKPSYRGKAVEVRAPGAALLPSDNVPVTEHERFCPKERLRSADGTQVFDFGQNLAGYPEFTVKGRRGQHFIVRCGEMLDEKGHVALANIQETKPAAGFNGISLVMKLTTGKIRGKTVNTPLQEISFTCSGQEDHYKTSFSVFGFRYAEMIGDPEVKLENMTAIAVYSDLAQTGDFNCSDARVNQLVSNTRWSMKSNFLDVPTDCPTRERLGWTGDAQIFFDTGAYFMDTAPFFSKWLRDMEDAQYPDGLLPAVLPYSGVEMMYKATGGSVGWADAVYLIPYRYYLRYGDREMLERCWPMMQRYAEYMTRHAGMKNRKAAKANPYNRYTYEKGVHLGEWLEPGGFQEQISAGKRHDHPEEATAYYYLTMKTLAEVADILHKSEDALKYRKTAEGVKKAYNYLFVRTGTLNDTMRQAKLVRPLALGLLDGEDREKAGKQLGTAVEKYNYRVGTGFLSTPFLLGVLTEVGESETAYRMLLNTKKPGWLYEVLHGATTIWETWEGYNGDAGSGSLNHYSPGAVCQWLFDTCAGICVDGENHFILSPVPGTGMNYAEGSYLSPYGKVISSWKKTERGTEFSFSVPVNCSAEICLPDGSKKSVKSGIYTKTI